MRFDGKLEGCCLAYDTLTGKIRSECTFSNDLRTGEWTYFDRAGRISGTAPVTNGKMNGMLKFYHSATGNLLSTKTAVDNKITGPAVFYFSACDGVSSSGNLVNDKKEGEWKYYHNCTNKIFSIAHYKAGVLDGHYTAYDKESGMKIIEGEDVNGEEDGEWKFYYPGTNKLRLVKHFKNGIYDGEMIGWWLNGKVRRRDIYNSSARTSWNCYTEDGRDTMYYSLKTDAVFLQDPQHFLTNQIVYPEVALEQHLSGKVVVSMHVEMDTHISNVRIVSSTNEVFNEEALRVAYTLPVVSPQLEDGVPFFSDVTMPIKFELPEP
jgi:TonB family protein